MRLPLQLKLLSFNLKVGGDQAYQPDPMNLSLKKKMKEVFLERVRILSKNKKEKP
jgi:hypothetical protein